MAIQIKNSPENQSHLFLNHGFGLMAFVLFTSIALYPSALWGQCVPTAANICVSSDDDSVVFVEGVSIGFFPYAGAPGTNDPAKSHLYECSNFPFAEWNGLSGGLHPKHRPERYLQFLGSEYVL